MSKAAAYTGIAAALGMAACDVILLGQPVSGWHYDLAGFGAMQHINATRATIGASGGLLCSFFTCFGYWHIKNMLQYVNAGQAMIMFVAFCSVSVFSGAFHAGYFFISGAHALPAVTVEQYMAYLQLVSMLAGPGFLIGNIQYYRLARNSNFAGWLKFVNPMLTWGAFLVLLGALPAPVGGYLRPAFINLGLAVFFVVWANASAKK